MEDTELFRDKFGILFWGFSSWCRRPTRWRRQGLPGLQIRFDSFDRIKTPQRNQSSDHAWKCICQRFLRSSHRRCCFPDSFFSLEYCWFQPSEEACCTKRGGEIILSASQAFVINAGLIKSITHSWTPGSEELLELFESSNNYWSFPCDVDVTLNLVTVAISSKNGQLHHSCWRTTTRTEKNRIGPELNNISLHKSVLSFFLPTL